MDGLAGSPPVSCARLETVGFLLAGFEVAIMTGLRALALALLLTLGTVGGVTMAATQQGPSMSVQTVENTSNYFGANASDVDRSGEATTSLDVAATVSANAGEVRSTFTDVSLRQHKYPNADSDEARRAVVRNGTDQLAQRVDVLEQKEMSTIDRYARGEISELDLFRTLASIDSEARELASTASWLQNRANENGMSAESRRLASLRIRLVALSGPVRTDIEDGLDGTTTTRIYAETAGDGLILATTVQDDDGDYVYVREAYTPAIRNRRDSDRYEDQFIEVLGRLKDIYPWVNEGGPDIQSSRIGTQGARLYSIEYSHSHGSLTPYLDGGTGRVVRETQRLRVDRIPTERTQVTSDDGDLLITVESTYDSGPLGVSAVDNETGQPVNATVLVDGDRVGRTGDDRLWTVDPRGGTNVTVVREDHSVTAQLPAS